MKLEKNHENSLKILIFLAEALKFYKENYPHVSDQALAKKIGVPVYFLSKFDRDKIDSSSLARIDILNLWNLIIFFKNRDILDHSKKKEFNSYLKNFLSFEEGTVRKVEITNQGRDESWIDLGEKPENEAKIHYLNDLDSFIVYSLCFTEGGENQDIDIDILNKIFTEEKTKEILSKLEDQGIISVLDRKHVRLFHVKCSVAPFLMKNLLIDLIFRFFDYNDAGKARMTSALYIGTLNDKGFFALQTLTSRYIRDAFNLFRREDFLGKIPVAFSAFMNAMIRIIPQRKRKFSRES